MNENLPPCPRAVLLDWDNTLVDTWPVIHDAMNTTLRAMGDAEWQLAETKERVRRALREAFPDIFGDRWEKARDIYYDRFQAIHLERLEIRPGADELLAVLAEKKFYLGVVSNKTGKYLRRETAHLGWDRYFGRVVGATDAANDKPAPDVVTLALEGSGIGAEDGVWLVGDTGIDLECAHNAACVPVLLRDLPPKPLEFGDFGPEMHFTDCAALTALVKKL
jgi:phosphoglycolate phosphatase